MLFSDQILWNTPRRLAIICLGIATISLSIVFILTEFWYLSLIALAMSAGWYYCISRGWKWGPSLVFFLQVVLVVIGYLINLNTVWLLFTLVFFLASWDLSSLGTRFFEATEVLSQPVHLANHIRRLAAVLFVGSVLAITADSIEFRLSFGWLAALGFLTIIGFSLGINYLLRKSH